MTCGRSGTTACPLQVFVDTTISANGTGNPRDDGFTTIYPATNQFCQMIGNAVRRARRLVFSDLRREQGASASRSAGAWNRRPGQRAITVDGNGVNGGAFHSSAFNPADTVPAPGSGLAIDDGGTAVVTGTAGAVAIFSHNAAHGIDLAGTLDALFAHATANAGSGIFVHTRSPAKTSRREHAHRTSSSTPTGTDGLHLATEAPRPPPASTQLLSSPGDHHARRACPNLVLAGDRPTLQSETTIHDNLANGITVGSLAVDATGQPLQTGPICVQLGDADIHDNAAIGVETAQPAASTFTRKTPVIFLYDDIYTNGATGLVVHPSAVGQAAGVGTPTFSQNKIHDNALNQVVFSGGGNPLAFSVNSPSNLCDTGANAVYRYAARHVYGFFGQVGAIVAVEHTALENAGPGLNDTGAQSGSSITVGESCDPIFTCP